MYGVVPVSCTEVDSIVDTLNLQASRQTHMLHWGTKKGGGAARITTHGQGHMESNANALNHSCMEAFIRARSFLCDRTLSPYTCTHWVPAWLLVTVGSRVPLPPFPRPLRRFTSLLKPAA